MAAQSEAQAAQNAADTLVDALNPGDVLLHGQYRIDRYLNAGGFGITYLAYDSLDRKVVIKECFPNAMCCRSHGIVHARAEAKQEEFRKVVTHFEQEARRISKLKHPHIVGVHQVFQDNGTAYMALDFVEGRDLLDIIEFEPERLGPKQIKKMLIQLLEAIAYIHERRVLHRDISPDNILVDGNNNPVLIDFGAARDVATRASRALSAMHVVKDGYSPQEFYLANNMQSPASDLYSLAATFYHLITGSAPPNSQVRLASIAAGDNDPYEPIPPRTAGYDHFFLRAIDVALAVFPKDRLASAEAWIAEIDKLRRREAMMQKARKDEELDMSIRQLTEETNAEMEAEKRKDAAAAKKQEKIKRRARKPVKQKKPEPRYPELAAEFADDPADPNDLRDLWDSHDPYKMAKHEPAPAEEPVYSDYELGLEDPRETRRRRRSLLGRVVAAPFSLFSSRKQNARREDRRARP